MVGFAPHGTLLQHTADFREGIIQLPVDGRIGDHVIRAEALKGTPADAQVTADLLAVHPFVVYILLIPCTPLFRERGDCSLYFLYTPDKLVIGSRTDHYDFILLCFLVCYKGRAYMDSLKRGRYDFFLIICSELILNGSCGEEGSVFYRNPRPVLGIFIGRNAIAYCDSTLNGVLIRTGLQRNTRIGSLYGCKYGRSGKFLSRVTGENRPRFFCYIQR